MAGKRAFEEDGEEIRETWFVYTKEPLAGLFFGIPNTFRGGDYLGKTCGKKLP
jgi:hypothetical protein